MTEISSNITPADFSTVLGLSFVDIQPPNNTPSKLVVINATAEPRKTTQGA
jgi:hypothetical protein